MKKAVFIIAEKDFRDEELAEPKAVLEKAGIEVKIASTRLGDIKGALGKIVKSDILISDIKIGDYDAVVFVGGQGAQQYWDDPLAHEIAKEAYAQGKVVAAICIAPATLAKSGILKGKRATAFPSVSGYLEEHGAQYSAKPVEIDGKIITASGPAAARQFGEEIAKVLK